MTTFDEQLEAAVLAHTEAAGFISPDDLAYDEMRPAIKASNAVLAEKVRAIRGRREFDPLPSYTTRTAEAEWAGWDRAIVAVLALLTDEGSE